MGGIDSPALGHRLDRNAPQHVRSEGGNRSSTKPRRAPYCGGVFKDPSVCVVVLRDPHRVPGRWPKDATGVRVEPRVLTTDPRRGQAASTDGRIGVAGFY